MVQCKNMYRFFFLLKCDVYSILEDCYEKKVFIVYFFVAFSSENIIFCWGHIKNSSFGVMRPTHENRFDSTFFSLI